MNWFITGSSGFLGINLVRHLLKKNQSVVGFDIAPFNYPEKIEHYQGDIRNWNEVRAAMLGADVVVHCAAALPLHPPQEIWDVDVNGTRTVFEQASEMGVRRVIHISSTAVYGIPDHHPLLETDPLVGVGPYGKAKIEAERIAQSYRGVNGMRVAILRPKSFIGPERLGVFSLLYEWASEGKNFPVIGNKPYQLLDVEDLCSAIWLCVARDADDVFNIGAEEYKSLKEDFQSLLDYTDYHKKVIEFPEKPVVMALKLLEKLKLSPLYPWIYETAGKESFVSIDKAKRKLNFRPLYSNRAALIRNYAWYLNNRNRLSKGLNHRSVWEGGALGLIKHLF